MFIPFELKQKYLERRAQDVLQLMESLEKDDFTVALKVGHQMKGNALTFDFPILAQIGYEMEEAAKKKDSGKIQYLLTSLHREIQLAKEVET